MELNTNLTMYAIVDSTEEGYYWNFKKEDMDSKLNGECLLPTKEMAEQYIEEELAIYYKAIEVNIESISKIGTWCYSTTEDEIFDEYFDE